MGPGKRALLTGLGIGTPIAVAIAVVGGMAVDRPPSAPVAARAAPTVTMTATPTPIEPSAPPTPSSPAPAPSPSKAPQGVVLVTSFHDGDATNTCVSVQTFYENRSDTAVNTVTQSFVTLYTPKHKAGTYPSEVDGPIKTLTTTVGIAPFQSRWVVWQAWRTGTCRLAEPSSSDGTDAFMSEIGAQPTSLTWKWFS